MKILIVLTSHDRLGDTDRKTGFWLEDLAAPYYVLREGGATLTLAWASPATAVGVAGASGADTCAEPLVITCPVAATDTNRPFP